MSSTIGQLFSARFLACFWVFSPLWTHPRRAAQRLHTHSASTEPAQPEHGPLAGVAHKPTARTAVPTGEDGADLHAVAASTGNSDFASVEGCVRGLVAESSEIADDVVGFVFVVMVNYLFRS
jgi:hypothetical protein